MFEKGLSCSRMAYGRTCARARVSWLIALRTQPWRHWRNWRNEQAYARTHARTYTRTYKQRAVPLFRASLNVALARPARRARGRGGGLTSGDSPPESSETFRNPQKPARILGNPREPSETLRNPQKPSGILSNPPGSPETFGNPLKPLKIIGNPGESSATSRDPWKPPGTLGCWEPWCYASLGALRGLLGEPWC